MGANSYRTSHYPYAEEILDFADQNGIVIIGLVIFSHHHYAMISLVWYCLLCFRTMLLEMKNCFKPINSFYVQMSVLQWPLTTLTLLFWKTTSRYGQALVNCTTQPTCIAHCDLCICQLYFITKPQWKYERNTAGQLAWQALPHCCTIFPCYLVWKSMQRPNEQWQRWSSWHTRRESCALRSYLF